MDLSLTENQELIRSSARELIERECPKEMLVDLDVRGVASSGELWAKVAGAGWLGILVPEEYGGAGGSSTDAGVLFQELGRGPVAGPMFSSGVLGATLLMEAGTDDQKREFLPAIATGDAVLVLTRPEAGYGGGRDAVGVVASATGQGFVLNGVEPFVHDITSSTHLFCTARTGTGGGLSLFLVDAHAPGLSRRDLPGFLTGVGEVTLESVEVPRSAVTGELGQGLDVLCRVVERTAPILCAYKVGGCEAVFDMSVAYSRTRVQFGTPIGRFQRVQDHIIELVNHLDAARWTTYEALWKVDAGRSPAASVHLAKAVASEAYHQACNYAHEVHAGVGVMREYGLTLHTKMSRTLYHYLGSPRDHKRSLAETLGFTPTPQP